MDRPNIPSLVRSTRNKLKLSQEDFGRILGTGKFAVWSWEKGKNLPSKYVLEIILELAKANTVPSKENIKDAFIIGGSPFALFLILKEIYENKANGNKDYWGKYYEDKHYEQTSFWEI